jgi:B-box zinc finger
MYTGTLIKDIHAMVERVVTVQLVRSAKGEIRGVAVLRGGGHIEAGREGEKPWRLCDSCTVNHAIVFCTTDNVYVCADCLPVHTMPGLCRFLSTSAAREATRKALTTQPSWMTVEKWR